MRDLSNAYFKNRYAGPVVTGAPQVQTQKPQSGGPVQENGGPSFKEVLQKQLSEGSELSFSKHAVSRVMERGIDVSRQNLERLGQGVRIAQQKGLDGTLVLVDQTAYIVSAKNSTVITTVTGDDLKGNVFTNIDGTVII